MRKVHKHKPVTAFSQFVEKNHPKKWEDMDSDVSRQCRNAILTDEQNGLGAYTEMPLTLDTSHIDHFKKRSIFPELIFDWNNFVVDSMDEEFGAKYKDRVIRKETYSEIFNPVSENVEKYFYYREDGAIIPIGDSILVDVHKVEKTIEIFNLNHQKLMRRRKELQKMFDEGYFYSNLDDDDILSALHNYGFTSLIEQKLLERTKLSHIKT